MELTEAINVIKNEGSTIRRVQALEIILKAAEATLQKPTPSERLDQGTAVFNGHLNDASRRASIEFIAQFGQETFDKKILPYWDRGIMSIFEEKPGKYATAWVTLVTAYVNEDRG